MELCSICIVAAQLSGQAAAELYGAKQDAESMLEVKVKSAKQEWHRAFELALEQARAEKATAVAEARKAAEDMVAQVPLRSFERAISPLVAITSERYHHCFKQTSVSPCPKT